ncbi:hypothetical protein Agabi119p4_2606 [Agaricus bisporus var. burnettii]|uniref:Uncharacterized protein n=1 Tax=Agaricus bisporus var. burnettii TaxID=192524 RepID=A0A8H7F9F1_AGABI|nr:hypothetical protein Agabi119p4_2606 [Agaricus bisporus var. burnettii]
MEACQYRRRKETTSPSLQELQWDLGSSLTRLHTKLLDPHDTTLSWIEHRSIRQRQIWSVMASRPYLSPALRERVLNVLVESNGLWTWQAGLFPCVFFAY